MIGHIYGIIFYQPIYNALIGLIDIIPTADVGLAVVILTIVVKLILFPLTQKALITQLRMKELEKPLATIKEKYKDNAEEQTKQTFALYKKYEVNPFSGMLTLLIQLPVILTLYWVFTRGGLPTINTSLLYGFVHVPAMVSMKFLGLINIHVRSIFLAVCAGLSQFAQAHYSLRDQELAPSGTSFKDDMMQGMQIQMRYVLPLIIFAIGLGFAGAITLYWTVSNLFIVGQEIYLRKIGLKGPNRKKLDIVIE